MKNITVKQQNILDFIIKFKNENGYPPTLSEIADKVGIKSTTAYSHVKSMVKKGYLTRCRSARSIHVVLSTKDA